MSKLKQAYSGLNIFINNSNSIPMVDWNVSEIRAILCEGLVLLPKDQQSRFEMRYGDINLISVMDFRTVAKLIKDAYDDIYKREFLV